MMTGDASRRSLVFVREIRTPDEGIAAQQGLRQATNLLGLEGYEQTRLNTAAAELIREAGLPPGEPAGARSAHRRRRERARDGVGSLARSAAARSRLRLRESLIQGAVQWPGDGATRRGSSRRAGWSTRSRSATTTTRPAWCWGCASTAARRPH